MFEFISKENLEALTASREGETKLGETLYTLKNWDDLDHRNEKFVVLGLKEDIGIRANLGKAGAANAWDVFLSAFCNVQQNSFFNIKNVLIAGVYNPRDLMQKAATLTSGNDTDLKKLRSLTNKVDEALIPIVQQIVNSGKIPVLIGGGHNNAFPIISGCSSALKKPLNCLNIDPHADFRALEGRHSGNGFSYAYNQQKLMKYAVWGLHEGYNNQVILDAFSENSHLSFTTMEQLLHKTLDERDSLLKNTLHWLGTDALGLELDCDSIEGFPASALNASGFSINEIRHTVSTISALSAPVYFHICEAAPCLTSHESEKAKMGKRLAYFVLDFIKAHPTWN